MLRFLLILIALVVLLRLLGWRPPGAGRRPAAEPAATPRAGAAPEAAELVACAHCGLYLPRAQALVQDGLHFCSDEHRRRGAGRSGGRGG